MKKPYHFNDTDMQVTLGWVLRIGVILSITIVFTGGVIYLVHHGHETTNYRTFKGVPDFIMTTKNLFNSAAIFRGRAIIQIGIILLILTPIIRVLFSAIGFVLEKDYLYVGITLLVLLIICISMLTGHAG